jgi:hypothetical protein
MTVGYRVPSIVAVTSALASGGGFPGSTPPPGAVGIDLPVDRTPQTVVASGSLLVTWPAMGAGQFGAVTALGVSTTDATTTRITTQVDGIQAGPFNQTIGAAGTLDAPTPFGAPIALGPGQVFSVLLENTDAANPQDMSVRTLGWRV